MSRSSRLWAVLMSGVLVATLAPLGVGVASAQSPPAKADCADVPAASGAPVAPKSSLAAGTTIVTSDDGKLTLEIPPGAVPPGVDVSVRYRDPACAAPELAGVRFRNGFYAIEPADVTFNEPVEVTRTITLDALSIDPSGPLPEIVLAERTADGTWSWLEAMTMITDVDEGVITLSGSTQASGDVYGFATGESLDVTFDPEDLVVQVGQSSTITLQLQQAPLALAMRAGGDSPVGRSGTFDQGTVARITAGSGQVYVGTVVTTGPNGEIEEHDLYESQFECTAPGTAKVEVRVQSEGLGTRTDLVKDLGLDPARLDSGVHANQTCIGFEGQNTVEIAFVCAQVRHKKLGAFLSRLQFILQFSGIEVDEVQIKVKDANNGEEVTAPVVDQEVLVELGLDEAGPKTIQRIQVITADDQVIDVTDLVLEDMPETLTVRYPEEDDWGDCPD